MKGAQRSSADRLIVFGSVARADKAIPGDIDIVLDARDCDDWEAAHQKYGQTVRGLLALAKQHYGWLDPFVWAGKELVVRNDASTGYVRSRNRAALLKAIHADGRPVSGVSLPA